MRDISPKLPRCSATRVRIRSLGLTRECKLTWNRHLGKAAFIAILNLGPKQGGTPVVPLRMLQVSPMQRQCPLSETGVTLLADPLAPLALHAPVTTATPNFACLPSTRRGAFSLDGMAGQVQPFSISACKMCHCKLVVARRSNTKATCCELLFCSRSVKVSNAVSCDELNQHRGPRALQNGSRSPGEQAPLEEEHGLLPAAWPRHESVAGYVATHRNNDP